MTTIEEKIAEFVREEKDHYQYQMKESKHPRVVNGTFMSNTIDVAGRKMALAGYVKIERVFNSKKSRELRKDVVDMIFATQIKGLIITPGEQYAAQGFYIWSDSGPHNAFKTDTAAIQTLKTRMHKRINVKHKTGK